MARPGNFDFLYNIIAYYEKLGHILKPVMPKFRPDLPARLGYIAKKHVPATLKPIVNALKISIYYPVYLKRPKYASSDWYYNDAETCVQKMIDLSFDSRTKFSRLIRNKEMPGFARR